MKLVQYHSAREFQAAVWPLLLQQEAENNLMIGIVGELAAAEDGAPSEFSEPPLLVTVNDGQQILAAAWRTPPYRFGITRASPAVAGFLAEELHRLMPASPGVVGPLESAGLFSTTWARITGAVVTPGMALRIYQLDRVIPVTGVPGRLEPATLDDLDQLVPWTYDFLKAIHEEPRDVEESLRRRIQDGELFVWKTPELVSMGSSTGPTPNGVRVNHIYTPPEHRRHGYATALTAALSQRLLDSGRQFCFLFTDLANPTSNSIYQKIGYRPVCDFAEYNLGVSR